MKNPHSKYFTDSWKVRALLYLHDALFFLRKKPKPIEQDKINNILICNWATLGDILLVTSILPAIKQKWPEAKIDFLTSPDSKILLENHPLINKIYTASNWKQEALAHSLLSQLRLFFYSLTTKYSSLVKELQKRSYDLAIDTHPFFPNTACILKKLKIPHVVTFTTAGLPPAYARAVNFPEKLEYLPKMYTHLLNVIGINSYPLKPCFYYTESPPILQEDYIIFHIGTTEERREWEITYWQKLAQLLSSEGFKIVFTGKGAREQKAIKTLAESCPSSVNLCDQLRWSEFLSVIKQAQAVISVNTVTVHLAAALGTPVLGLYLATKYLELWIPDSELCSFLVQDIEIAYLSDPFFLKKHKNIQAVSEITPEIAYACFKKIPQITTHPRSTY